MALFHGFLESPALWQACPRRLWEGHDCHALALPGHGPWPGLQNLHAMLAGNRFIDAYAERLERLRPGVRWRLVGHSTGALVALELARRRPDLVENICTIAPLFTGGVCGRNLQGALVRVPLLGALGFRWLVERWLSNRDSFAAGVGGVTSTPRANADALDAVRQDLRDFDPDALYRFGCWIGGQDMRVQLGALDAPVHAMLCSRDPVVQPSHQLALVSTAPGASAILLPTGHLPMIEAPDDFAAAFMAWSGAAPHGH